MWWKMSSPSVSLVEAVWCMVLLTSAVDAGRSDSRVVPPRPEDLIQDLFLLLPEVYLRTVHTSGKGQR